MSQLYTLMAVTFVLFTLCVVGMAVGLFFRGKIMRGGCGSRTDADGHLIACESCSKKTLNLCDDESSPELAEASFTATMGRFQRNK